MLKKSIVIISILVLGAAIGWLTYPIAKNRLFPGINSAPETPAISQGLGIQPSGPFASVVKAAFPTVVNISTVKISRPGESFGEDPFFDFFNDFLNPRDENEPSQRWKEQSFGSGVIVTSDGYIITNNHVIEDAERIRVTLYDGRIFAGQVIGADPKTDLAVVKISANGLPALPWGDSDKLGVGQFVLAIGNPFGLSHTVTMGIVSAMGRANVGIADYEDFIQTDAAINPGNSGGPLVNTEGRLVGINTAIFSRSGGYQGIGFAVPSNMAHLVMEQLVTEGRVIRGWLGVNIQDLTPELANKFQSGSTEGALIVDVVPGSPAEDAGLKSGDIVREYDGRHVSDSAELRNMVARSIPGTRAPVQILRNGQLMRAVASVKELPGDNLSEMKAPRTYKTNDHDTTLGLGVIALTEDIARQLRVPSSSFGVVVSTVREGSPADDAGLKRGDMIIEIERQAITSVSQFHKLIAQRPADGAVLMLINRAGRKFYLTLDIM